MQLTTRQKETLVAAFRKGGANYGRRGNLMGGAFRRMCQRMAEDGLLTERPPFEITVKGLVVLRDIWQRRYGDQGTMAALEDLQAVEKALAEVPHLAALAESRMAA